MIKRNILILFFLLVINGFLFGQVDNPKTKFYQIGLNVGPLWTNLIHHEQTQAQILNQFFFPIFDTPEVLSFKVRKNKIALRLGMGAQYNKQKLEDESNAQNNILFRIGIEKQIDFTKRWQCYYGIDLKVNVGKIDFDFDDDPYKWHRIGLASLFGIQYRLTPRLILQTEASLQFSQITTFNSDLFFINPFPFPIEPGAGSEKTKSKTFDIVLPNLLYLAFEF